MRNATKGWNIDVPNLFIGLLCINSVALVMFSSQYFYNLSVFSLCQQLFIVLNMVLALAVVVKSRIKQQSVVGLCLVVLMAIGMLVTHLLQPGESFYSYFTVHICGYVAVPLYMVIAQEIGLLPGTRRLVLVFAVACALFFVIFGILDPTYRVEGYLSSGLSYGYSNPNRAGMYLMLVTMLLLVSSEYLRPWYAKGAVWVLVALLLYTLILTKCRTAFLLAVAVAAYAALPRPPKLGRRFLMVCTFAPLLFSVLYVWLYNSGMLQSVELFGKPIFSGRQEGFVEEFMGFTLFGFGSKVGFPGLNVGIGLINGIGVVGAVLFYWYMLRFNKQLLYTVSASNDSRANRLIVFCVGMIYLHGCTEVSLFTAGSVYAFLIGMILLLYFDGKRHRVVGH